MGNFGRNDRGGNRGGGFRGGNRGGHSSFGGGRGGDRREVEMHKAICDKCHKECEVPFRPSGDKPIYCNECFSGKREGGDRGGRKDFGNRNPRREFNDKPMSKNTGADISLDVKKQLSDMNSKLDRLISVIENLSAPKAPSAKVKEVSKTVKTPVKKVAPKAKTKKATPKKKK